MEKIEKRKNFIINTFYIAIVAFLFYVVFKYAFAILLPFFIAMFIAYLLQKPVNAVQRKTHIKKGIISVALVFVCFSVFIGLLVLVVMRLFSELKGLFDYLVLQFSDTSALLDNMERAVRNMLTFLPQRIQDSAAQTVREFLASYLSSPSVTQKEPFSFDFSILSGPIENIWHTAKQIPVTLVAFLVSFVSCCFMTADFRSLKNVILSLFPTETRKKVIRAKRLLFPALSKMAKAYLLIFTITFCELCVGMFLMSFLGIFKSDYIPIIAIIIALIDIVPVLGTGTVVIPWALYSLFTGNIPLAVGLLIMYVCITVIRQIIEPKLVASQLGLPAFATLMAMYIGSQIFGFIGLFLLPITLVMIKLLNDDGIINVFHKDVYDETEGDLND